MIRLTTRKTNHLTRYLIQRIAKMHRELLTLWIKPFAPMKSPESQVNTFVPESCADESFYVNYGKSEDCCVFCAERGSASWTEGPIRWISWPLK